MSADPSALHGLITGVPQQQLEELAAASREITYARGETVFPSFAQLVPGVVASGRLRLAARATDGREATLRILNPGTMFGLPALFQAERSIVPVERSIVAVSRSTVVMFDGPTLVRLSAAVPAVAMHLARNLADAATVLGDMAGQFAFMSVRQRLAAHLLTASETDSGGREVALVTQQELANGIGSVREVVARTLHHLRQEQIVRVSPGRIEVLKPHELSQIALGAI